MGANQRANRGVKSRSMWQQTTQTLGVMLLLLVGVHAMQAAQEAPAVPHKNFKTDDRVKFIGMHDPRFTTGTIAERITGDTWSVKYTIPGTWQGYGHRYMTGDRLVKICKNYETCNGENPRDLLCQKCVKSQAGRKELYRRAGGRKHAAADRAQ